MERPDLSVIVVTFNGRELALATLRSARAALGADQRRVARRRQRLERRHRRRGRGGVPGRDGLPLDRTAASPPATTSRCRTRAAATCCCSTPTSRSSDGTFAELVAALDARPEVGVASVLQRATDGTLLAVDPPLPDARARASARRSEPAACRGSRGSRSSTRTSTATARSGPPTGWSARSCWPGARPIEQTGPLDEGFFLYAEETDWCRRFRLHGWDVRHLPQMTITHHEGDNKRPEMVGQLGHSRRRYAYKHFALAARGRRCTPRWRSGTCCGSPSSRRWRRCGRGYRRRARAEAFGLAVVCGAPPPYGAEDRRAAAR